MAGTVVADTLQADSTSTLVLKNGVANTPPTIQDSAGTQIGTFCRAWVNFNGTTNTGGFCTIRASFNVTSVADNGAGDYTVNFTTAMPDANYATKITTNRSSNNTTLVNISRIADELSAPTVSSVRIAQGVPDVSRVLQREDASFIMVSIFR